MSNYKGGYAILDMTDRPLNPSDPSIYAGAFDTIDKAVKAQKPVYIQNFNIEGDVLAPTSGYTTFIYDATNDAYVGLISTFTDFNGDNLGFILIGVDKDDYCAIYLVEGASIVPKATTSKEGIVKKCSKVTDATSETIVTQFNDLLSKMKTAGMMSGS